MMNAAARRARTAFAGRARAEARAARQRRATLRPPTAALPPSQESRYCVIERTRALMSPPRHHRARPRPPLRRLSPTTPPRRRCCQVFALHLLTPWLVASPQMLMFRASASAHADTMSTARETSYMRVTGADAASAARHVTRSAIKMLPRRSTASRAKREI